jgi:hypothetical protein
MYVTFQSRLRVALIAAALALLGACSTVGGGRGGPPPGAGRSLGEPGEAGSGMACRTLVEQNRETFAQAARLLALTPPQQVLWEDYAQSVRTLIDDSLRLEPYKGAHRSALAQIDDKAQAARQRVAQMERIATQAATLYRALDEAQKRVADRNLPATIPEPYAGTLCLAGDGPGDAGRPVGRPGGSGGAPR